MFHLIFSHLTTQILGFESTPAQGGLTFTKAQPDWKKKTWDQYGEYLG
jgi:hypothetical protein